MKKLQIDRTFLVFTLSLAVSLCAAEACLAKKGGNGGGNPGGGDPPVSAPVSYSVTPVTIPGSSYAYLGHNDDAAVVGTVYNTPAGGRRAMAYVPSISTTEAFYLDNPALGVSGIPGGWHTRSAVGINSQGTIVGNLESDANSNITHPFLLTGLGGGVPMLQELGPFDVGAEQEAAVKINDNGDIVIWSHKIISGTPVDSLYVGNQGQTAPFTKIDFATYGIANATVFNDTLRLSNQLGSSPAMLTGTIYDGSESQTFRMNFDGTGFELAPDYTEADGSQRSWQYGNDINDLGDIAGQALASPVKQGKIKNRVYGAVWEAGSDQIVAAPGVDNVFQTQWSSAKINNDGDSLLANRQTNNLDTDTLWHDDWSATNGVIKIADLIDPDDPNRDLFNSAHEMTDHGSTDWPTIIAYSTTDFAPETLLILNPVLNVASASSTAIPEPTTAVLFLMALVPLLRVRRVRSDR